MKNSSLVRCCPSCGANNIQSNKNIVCIVINGPIRQYECNQCGKIWTVDFDVEGKVNESKVD